jgi:site-specific recombinase XerD
LKFLKEYKGKNDIITICNVTKADIYNYVAYLDKYSKNTKENRLASIYNFYKFLDSNLSRYLFRDIKLFNTTQKTPRILSSFQIKQLLNYYSGRNQLIIFIFLSTGIRLSELQSLKIENINFEERFFTVKVKGGYFRDVHFPKKCSEMLQDYIGDRTEGLVFGIKNRAIETIVTKAMKNLGIIGSTHTLRHTFATVMYKQTKDILLVRELLGHKTVTSTQIYAYVDNDEIRNAVNSNPLARYGEDEN